MSSSTNNTSSSLFTSPTTPPPQQTSWWRSKLSSGWNLVTGAANLAATPVSWAFSKVGDGLVSGALQSGEREIAPMLESNGKIAKQFKTLLKDAFIEEPPEQLYQLKQILEDVLIGSQPMTPERVNTAAACCEIFTEETLAKLVPDLNEEGQRIVRQMALFLKASVRDESIPSPLPPQNINISDQRQELEQFAQLIGVMIERHQGALVQAMAFLQEALVSNKSGILGQAIDILKSKFLDDSQSALRPVYTQLSTLFGDSADSYTTLLDDTERRTVSAALSLLRQKTLPSLPGDDAKQNALSIEEKETIRQALALAKAKIAACARENLQVLLAALHAGSGLMHSIKGKCSADEQSSIARLQALIETKLESASWTREECVLLCQGITLLATRYAESHERTIKDSLDLIEKQLTGPVDEEQSRGLKAARTLLQAKWVSLGKISDRLQNHLLTEKDAPIITAAETLSEQLSQKLNELRNQALPIIHSRLNADEFDLSPGRKLKEEERDLFQQVLSGSDRSQLCAALRILSNRHATAEQALQAAAFAQSAGRIDHELTTLEKLREGLTDPALRVILPLLKTAQQQLISSEGPLTALESRLENDNQGIITQAIDLLNTKLFEVGGPIDGFRRNFVDDGGILDEAMRLLSTRLLDSERGILVQATSFLSSELTDENKGVLAKAIDVLNKKLQAEDGPLATLDSRLNNPENGILAKAIGILNTKLFEAEGPVEKLSKTLTSEEGIFAEALRLLNEGLNAEDTGILSRALATLNTSLTDENTGILARAIEVLNTKLNDERGPLATLDQKLTDEQTGILARAIGVLNTKLFEENGTVDRLTRALSGEGGVLDLAITRLSTRLLEPERGILAQAAAYLNSTLADENEGTLAKALDVLNKKLKEEGGLLDTLDRRLNHEETGIIANALKVFDEKLNQPGGFLENFNMRLNATAHPLIAKALTSAKLLESASLKNAAPVQQRSLARELSQAIVDLQGLRETIFAEHPLRARDMDKLLALQVLLQRYATDPIPTSAEIQGVLTEALEVLEHHHHSQQGLAARTAATLSQQLEKALLRPNGVVDQFNERVNASAHPQLIQARKDLAALQKAYEQGASKQDLFDKSRILLASLEAIRNNQNTVFEKSMLRYDDLETMRSLRVVLRTFSATSSPSKERMRTHFQRAGEMINHHCIEQAGLIARTTDNLINQFSAALLEPNGPLDQLNDRLNGSSHPALSQCAQGINTLKDAIAKQATKAHLFGLAAALSSALETVERERSAIFQRTPLRDGDLNTLRRLRAALALFDGTSMPPKDQLTPVLESAETVIHHHIKAQGGLVAGTVQTMADQLTHSVMQPNGFVNQLGRSLTDPSHPQIAQARDALVELRNAVMKRTPKTKLIALANALKATLQALDRSQEEIFLDPPLRDGDMETLRALLPQLDRFSGELLPTKDEVLPAMKAASMVLEYHYHAQAGYADQFVDAVTKGLDPLLSRFERLPRSMYDAFMGRDPETGEIEESTDEESGQVTIGSYLQKASDYLGQFLKEGSSLVSQKAVSTIAGSLLYALEGALDSIEGKENFARPRAMLQTLISKVTVIQSTGSATELQNTLKGSLDLLNSFKIYINGFRVPKIGTIGESVENPEASFLQNITRLQQAMESRSTENEDGRTWKVKAEKEKQKFVDNTTTFFSFKLIYENLCGLRPDDERMYFRIMSAASESVKQVLGEDDFSVEYDTRRQELLKQVLKEDFFARLDAANVGTVMKSISKVAYFLLTFVFNRFIQSLSTTYLEEAFEYIKQNNADSFVQLKNDLIQNFTRYLTILGGAEERIAKNPCPVDTLAEMRKIEMEKPESNMGYSQNQLYSLFSEDLINKCTGNRFLGWLFKKCIGNPEQIIDSIINKSFGSLMDTNGYTHALNCVLVEQLYEILDAMQQEYADSHTEGRPLNATTFSSHKQKELTGLVKNLFEVLQKSKCQTKDELKALIEGRSLSDNLVKAVDDLFIQDVIENITNMVALTIGTLLKEDQLHKLTYKFTNLVNQVYDVGESPTLDVTSAKEKELMALNDRILNLSILTAVEEKFDFTGNKEQDETNRQIRELKRKTQEFASAADRDLQVLEQRADLNSLESTNKLKTLLDEAQAYIMESSTASFEAKGSKLNADNKEELKIRYLAVTKNAEPFVEHITEMRKAQKVIEEHTLLRPELEGIINVSQAITHRLCQSNIDPRDINWSRDQISILEHHLQQVNAVRHQGPLTAELSNAYDLMAFTLNEFQRTVAIMEFTLMQASETCLISQIVRDKRNALGALLLPSSIRSNIQLLKAEINSLNDNDLKRRLFEQIHLIETSNHSEQLDAAFAEYRRISLQAMAQASNLLNEQKTKIRTHSTEMQRSIRDCGLLNLDLVSTQTAKMRRSLGLARQSLTQIRNSFQKGEVRLLAAEKAALALKNSIKANEQGPKLAERAAQLSRAIQTLLDNEAAIFREDPLQESERTGLIGILPLLNRYTDPSTIPSKNEAMKELNKTLGILNTHSTEQSKSNAFKPVAYHNIALMDMNSFKNWATELVFGRVKERVDGLMEFIRREDTYKYGIINHMFLIPYVQHIAK